MPLTEPTLSSTSIPGKTFIFVTGLHHSGTSLLHRLLSVHPLVSGFSGTGVPQDEGQHLQSVVPAAKAFGGPGRFGFDARSHLDESSSLATADNAEKIYREWSRHWDLSKPFLVEKSPPTLLRMRFFQALFPNCAFVVILRHPIALTVATRRAFVRQTMRKAAAARNPFAMTALMRDWNKLTLNPNLEHTLLCYERALEDLIHIKRAFVLRYEDFVAQPDDALRELFAFLGLQPVAAAEPVRTNVNGRYFESWNRGALAPLRRRLARSREERGRRLGYSMVEPQTLLPLQLPGFPRGSAFRPR